MMSEQKDNQALEEYLKGNSELSKRYRAESTAEPPAQLDASILAAARKTVENQETGAGSSSSRWYIPLSLAAVVVISFGVVFKIHEQDGQQTMVKQPEMKKEQPAMMMEEHPEPAAAPSAIIMRDESFISEEVRIETDSASATRAAPAAGEDVSKDDSLSDIEPGLPATQSVESLSIPAERRMLKSEPIIAEDKADTSNVLEPAQWFEIINQLWFDGNEAGAYKAVNKFLEAYPDYPPEELKKQIPAGMDLSQINPD
jgi:hypothetical protein